MIVYLHDEKTKGVLQRLCIKHGLSVLTPRDVQRRKRSSAKPKHDFFLDEVDLLIFEITRPTQTMQFILAQAILAEKPTLCLYGKNQPPIELLQVIKYRSAPRPIKTFSYTDRNLSSAIAQFIQLNDPESQQHDDAPAIKFTLRLTPRIERYLTQYTKVQKISKADYIRALLTTLAKEQEEGSVQKNT